jgi:hypothetical protein
MRFKSLSVATTVAAVLLAAGCAPAKPPEDPAVVAATQKWAALAKLPDWSGVWEVDWRNARKSPPRPKMNLTPEWQKKADAYVKAQAKGENLQGDVANCVPPGLPGMMTQPYPIEYLYQPDKVVILTEAYMQFRHVWTDGRAHPEDPDPAFNGHSIGHWDGDTLVVDTVGLNPHNPLAPGVGHSDKLHIVEKIHRVDKDWLEVETTLTDPEVLAEPYTSTTSYRHLNDELREYVCVENNHDSADAKGRPGVKLE